MKPFRHIVIALGIALGVVSCLTHAPPKMPTSHEIRFSPAKSIVFHADTAFTPAERKLLATAAQNIHEQSSGLLQITFIYDLNFDSTESVVSLGGKDLIMRARSDAPFMINSEGQSHILGFVTVDVDNPDFTVPVRMYVIYDRLDWREAVYEHVLMHELLHAFRLGHVDGTDSIMYPEVVDENPPRCMSENDAKELCRVYGCNYLHLNFCR